MSNDLSFTLICKNNQLVILDCLSKDEGAGRRLDEDINDFSRTVGRTGYCRRYVVGNRITLVAALKAIEQDCKTGTLFPALHFECHGDEERGLWLARSGEYISWFDLAKLIAPVNAATRNNTAVVLASCHGFKLKNEVSIKAPSPFHFLIAPDQEINAGAISDSVLPFYKVMIETGELNIALSHLDSKFRKFMAGEWFYTNITHFLTNSFNAKARAKMVEQAIDVAAAKQGFKNREQLRAYRAHAKKGLSNTSNLYKTVEKSFLHGQGKVPYEDIKRFVDYLKSIR